MKKLLVAMVLAFAVAATAQATQPQSTMTPAQPSAGQTAQPAQPAQPAAAGQAAPAGQAAAAAPCQPAPKKEIKDSNEYNAYTSALNAPSPQDKIAGFENFIRSFPNSAFKEEALEFLMNAYQQLGTPAGQTKMIESAKNLLQVNPNNVRALALLAYVSRATAGQSGNVQQAAADARQYGEKGLQALNVMPCPPEGTSAADVQKLRSQTSAIFNGSVGFGALQQKDYPTAQQHFQAAVYLEGPTAQESLNDVYSLALADLEPKPPNPQGLWYIARAIALSNNNAQIASYGKSKYIKYHGGDDGWDQLLAQAKAAQTNLPPENFAVAPAPSPAEQAAKLANTVDPKQMDFGQWELVLTNGDPATQQKVFTAIKGIEVPFAAKVIQSNKTDLQLAATADAIEQNKADVTVHMIAPIPAATMPKVAPGQEIQIVAKPDSYTQTPFMMQMIDGQLIAKKEPAKPKAGARKPTTRKKTTR